MCIYVFVALVPGMVESYDLASPWGLEYKTVVSETNQSSMPSTAQCQKPTDVTCSVNDRQGTYLYIYSDLLFPIYFVPGLASQLCNVLI